MPALSIIIINYKSSELVLDCIKSIQQTTAVEHEIIIVDNDSQDNSQEIILQQFPQVKWISMGYNSGFSRANNEGIKAAKSDCILLLNSDTIILDNAIDILVKRLQEQTAIAAASVQLLNADRTPQNAGNYFVKGGINMVLTLPILNTFFRTIGNFLKFRKPSIQSSEVINNVDWISGAFMMVKKSAIENAGLMDEDFFLFSEEIEWCSRLKKVGKIVVFTDAKVVHLEGGTTKKIEQQFQQNYYQYWTKKGAQLMLSHLLRIRKQYHIGWLLVNLFFYWLEIPVLFIASIFSKHYMLKNAIDYFKNVLRVTTYLPKIISNKPYFYKIM